MENNEKVEMHPTLKIPMRVKPNDDGTCVDPYEWDEQKQMCVLQIGNIDEKQDSD